MYQALFKSKKINSCEVIFIARITNLCQLEPRLPFRGSYRLYRNVDQLYTNPWLHIRGTKPWAGCISTWNNRRALCAAHIPIYWRLPFIFLSGFFQFRVGTLYVKMLNSLIHHCHRFRRLYAKLNNR